MSSDRGMRYPVVGKARAVPLSKGDMRVTARNRVKVRARGTKSDHIATSTVRKITRVDVDQFYIAVQSLDMEESKVLDGKLSGKRGMVRFIDFCHQR